jgi:PAS domain S-box-containing protein
MAHTGTGTPGDILSLAANVNINDNRFRNIVMQAPVGIVIMRGRDMIVEMANHTYLAIVDKKEEEFIGRSLYETLPEVRSAVAPLLSGIMDTGIPYHGREFEVPLNRFGKIEQTFFNFTYHPLKEDDDIISGIIVIATEVTDTVLAKKALETREAQFRNMVNQSPIAMTIFRGPEYVIEIANQALLKNIWRKEWHEVEGKKLLDVFPELNGQQYPALLKTVYDTGVAHRQNEAAAIVNSSDGSRTFYLDFEYAPLFETDGNVSGIMVTVYDVTEKVVSRNKIEDARKHYKALVETLPVAVFTVDKEGYIDLFNQAAVTLWGRTPVQGVDKWNGAHDQFALDGTRVPVDIGPMAIALKENRTTYSEVYIQRPDGELRHVISHPQPMHDSDGNVIGAVNVLVDITDTKNTEKALRASEEKFRLLANSMPQLIWTSTPEGELNYFSQSVYDYSGLTEEQVFTEGWLEIVHPDDREKNIALWTESITTGQPFNYEHRFRRNDGEYRWQLSRAVPLKDEQDNIVMWVGTSTDIHDRMVFANELKNKVDERTQELKASNDRLQRSNDELTQFTYVASHDLQEPLRKIQTFISRIVEMEGEKMSDKGRDFLERTQRSSERTQRLIQDLLEFSRTNTTEKFFVETDLNTVLAKVKDDFSERLQQTGGSITIAPLPMVNGISFQLSQLFTNLISNAIKFSKPGVAPHISIHAATVKGTEINHSNAEASRTYHHITVADNGIGFEAEFSERIFMVFQRLNVNHAEGTGIGLAICKKIVENHNGIITATSDGSNGAVFNIYLPV